MLNFISAFSPITLLPAVENAVLLPAFENGGLPPAGDFKILPMPEPGEVRILPFPDPGSSGWSVGAGRPTINFVHGTAENETIELAPGGIASGGGGDDIFVLKSAGDVQGSEFLGSITDFKDGDSLDLSQLGEGAAILDRQASLFSDRISIDFDADGAEDGHLFVSTGETPDLSHYKPMPLPEPIAWGVYDPAIGDGGSISIGNTVSLEAWLF